ncbi:MAG: hypothetical protein ABR905_04175 [Terracidiphilus sp.]
MSCSTNQYTVGGTVSGLVGSGLTLLMNGGGTNLPISANSSFNFSAIGETLTPGPYSVTVNTLPSSPAQICTVTNGSGTITNANITNVQVTCAPPANYTIGGTVSGLGGTGLVLQDNNGDNLAVSANGAFTFAPQIASGGAYSVTVLTQPNTPTQTCTVTNGSGTATANVTNVQVACTPSYYTISGTVSGLVGGGLNLTDRYGNGIRASYDYLTVNANGPFAFAIAIASGTAYYVNAGSPTSPPQQCLVTNGSGTATANVTNVQVVCSPEYTIGGTISGLTGSGLLLEDLDSGIISSTFSAAGNYAFDPQPSGRAYDIAIITQPTVGACSVSNPTGTVGSANVTNVSVNCGTGYTIGGTVSGLPVPQLGQGLSLQDNFGNNLPVPANGNFIFTNELPSGVTYSVTVYLQPTNPKATCTVTNSSGTVASANVTNVQVSCVGAGSTIGGMVTGLKAGTSVQLLDNGGDALTVISNGSFTFATAVTGGGPYAVTVGTAPANRNCVVSNPSGTASADVTNVVVACTGEWVWKGGAQAFSNPSGTWGTLGQSSSSFLPEPREYSATWVDGSDNVWIYGGYNPGESAGLTALNDEWNYNPNNEEWTWVAGQNFGTTDGLDYIVTPNYGTEGQASFNNPPGARDLASTWVDSSGNLWLLGGYTFYLVDVSPMPGEFGDMWRYSPIGTSDAGEWRWMGGPTGYPERGLDATRGGPGGRDSGATWVDSSGNLWLFGGYGLSGQGAPGVDYLGDTWKFNPSIADPLKEYPGEWSWLGGDFGVGNYGIQGQATPSYRPGGRSGAQTWTDKSGRFWLFGGRGYDAAGNLGWLNDLWMLDPSSETFGGWAFMGGPETINDPGSFGTLGLPASGNRPQPRSYAATWVDQSGNLWLFGGDAPIGPGSVAPMNDLWMYSPSATGDTGEWTWMGGSCQNSNTGSYGSESVPSSSNLPPSREGASTWTDSSGNFWLFAGGSYNDLWEYQP